jgi:hypothetical protein
VTPRPSRKGALGRLRRTGHFKGLQGHNLLLGPIPIEMLQGAFFYPVDNSRHFYSRPVLERTETTTWKRTSVAMFSEKRIRCIRSNIPCILTQTVVCAPLSLRRSLPHRSRPVGYICPHLENLRRGAANPQIAYDKEFAKTSISEVESYRKSAHKSIKFCVSRSFIVAKSVGFASITFL